MKGSLHTLSGPLRFRDLCLRFAGFVRRADLISCKNRKRTADVYRIINYFQVHVALRTCTERLEVIALILTVLALAN